MEPPAIEMFTRSRNAITLRTNIQNTSVQRTRLALGAGTLFSVAIDQLSWQFVSAPSRHLRVTAAMQLISIMELPGKPATATVVRAGPPCGKYVLKILFMAS